MVLIIPSFRIKLSAGTYQTQTQISYFVYCVKRGETLFIRFPLGGLTTYPLRYSWNCMKRRITCVFPIPFCFALQTTPRALINSDVKKNPASCSHQALIKSETISWRKMCQLSTCLAETERLAPICEESA